MKGFKVALVESGDASSSVPNWVREVFARERIEFSVYPCENRVDLAAHASESDLVWVWGSWLLNSSGLGVARNCGAILRSGSGTDNIPIAEATERNIVVINTPAAMADDVSDHTLALLLGVIRQIVAQDRLIRAGVWDSRRENNRWHLRGSTLGLIGFGNIAQSVAAKAQSFGLRILAYDPWVAEDRIRALGAEKVDFNTLLSTSNFISIHCPLTQETHHLIGEREFECMKPDAILINASRGPIVNESELIRALQQNRIGGAALDVFEREPLPEESPLRLLGNVVFTPHIAAYSDLFPKLFWQYSVESILAVAKGFWPRAVVNPSVSPKWPLRRRQWPHGPEIEGLSVDGDHQPVLAVE